MCTQSPKGIGGFLALLTLRSSVFVFLEGSRAAAPIGGNSHRDFLCLSIHWSVYLPIQ